MPPKLRLTLIGACLALLGAAPGRAGTTTADSIWDEASARQRALEQVPRGATVNRSSCETISVHSSDRYRCTVWFSEAPPATP